MSEVIGFIPKKEAKGNNKKGNKKTGNTNKGKVAPAQQIDDKKDAGAEGNDKPDKDQDE